jgi:opacity protein-like surface antigen
MYTALNYEIENPGEHKFGWMINGGLDVKLFERFTLRFSYNYLDSRVGYDNDNAYNSQRFSVSVKNNF